ncbi:MAG: DUF3042 family protein [Streptococcaceae bacterium]|nr:DUF3042 family protein [Streptococcaceae bacterium]
MHNKSFITGFVAGKAFTLIAFAAGALCIKTQVINPIKEKKQMIDNGRKRAARKRIAP